MDTQAVVQRGRQCPTCKTIAASPEDNFCVCGYQFTPNQSEVGVDANGVVIEIDGAAVVPGVKTPPAAAAVVVAVPSLTPAASPSPAVLTELRVRVWVDESPRHGRPDPSSPDYAAAPTDGPIEYVLSESLVAFGRAKTDDHDVVLEGDDAVSSFHGRFRRRRDGSWEVEHLSKSSPTVVRAADPGAAEVRLKQVSQRHPLVPGETVLVGDWFAISILEVNPI